MLRRSREDLPARFTRRRLLAPALAGAVVLVVGALAIVAPWDSESGNPILESALAAAGDGPVLHVVARERVAGQRYDVESGRPRPVTSVYESWVDPERGRVHAIQRSGGEVVNDSIVSMGGFGAAQTTATIAADYRRRLQEGELRIARMGTIGGRPVHWLATALGPGVSGFEAAVDAETYRLVRIQTGAGRFKTTTDFDVFESVARNEPDFVVRFAPPRVVSQTRPEGRRVDPDAAAREVSGAQWAGARVDGLPIREIRASDWRATLRPGGAARGVILTVAYGDRLGTIVEPASGSPTGVEIVQAADDSAAHRFLTPTGLPLPFTVSPPAGTFDLTAESSPYGTFFVATLRKPRVWIRVRASSRELLFGTVRALRPIPR